MQYCVFTYCKRNLSLFLSQCIFHEIDWYIINNNKSRSFSNIKRTAGLTSYTQKNQIGLHTEFLIFHIITHTMSILEVKTIFFPFHSIVMEIEWTENL